LLGALAQGLLELNILSSGKFGAAMWHMDLLDYHQYPDWYLHISLVIKDTKFRSFIFWLAIWLVAGPRRVDDLSPFRCTLI